MNERGPEDGRFVATAIRRTVAVRVLLRLCAAGRTACCARPGARWNGLRSADPTSPRERLALRGAVERAGGLPTLHRKLHRVLRKVGGPAVPEGGKVAGGWGGGELSMVLHSAAVLGSWAPGHECSLWWTVLRMHRAKLGA